GTVIVENTPGHSSATVVIGPPLGIDNCGSWNAFGTRSDGLGLNEPFNIGETTITWRTSATEPVGEAVEQIIKVVDAEAPTITPAGTVTVENTPGHCSATVVIEPPLVIDNCGSWKAFGTRSDGMELSDPYNIGETTITSRTSATEPVGETVEHIITVVDAEAPTITPAEPLTVESTLGECHAILTIEPPLVLDNCGSWDASGTRSDK